MRRVEALMIASLAIGAAAAIGQMTSAQQQPNQQKPSKNIATDNSERGQQVFKQNCSRCHQEPQGFSASISGTVARHMRVRAGLSNEDYKALLKFLNP